MQRSNSNSVRITIVIQLGILPIKSNFTRIVETIAAHAAKIIMIIISFNAFTAAFPGLMPANYTAARLIVKTF